MDSGLDGKVVLVTGASGGIGRAIADALVAEGALLALLAHAHLEDLERRVGERPWAERALCLGADVGRAGEVDAAFERALERFGRIDGCVANAGVWPREDVPLHELPEERVRATVETNLLGAVWTARAFLRALARSGPRDDGHGAALVLVGSTAGRYGERDHADYAVAKSGLRGLALTCKNEIVRLDPRGRANVVEPGWTVTEMVRAEVADEAHVRRATSTMALRQLGCAEDVARAVLFLLSPLLARHVTGEVIGVHGGMEGRRLWEDV